jgi:hypothetical protein
MKCTLCEEELDEEEIESPRKDRDGDIICDKCFDDRYSYHCPICEEMFSEDFSVKISPKYPLIAEYASEDIDIDSGIYEILSYPFYADGVIEIHIFKSAVKRISGLPNDLDEDDLWSDIYYVCDDCIKKMSLGTDQ